MLIAPTVLGQEVSATGSTETSAASTASPGTTANGTADTTPSATTGTGEAAGSGTSSGTTVATATTTNGGTQSTPAAAETTPQPQAQTATVASASTTASSSSSDGKAPQAASTTSSSTPAAASNNSNQEASAKAETPMMDVEQYKVDKEETELKVKDGKNPKNGSKVNKDTKLIRNRDDEQRDIVDIKREVKTNADGTIDVTVTVTPKEIDKGADVMALLDVSKKMTEEDFKNAKDKIKKLVTTLTSKSASNSDNDEHKHNSRNSVRLMTFYRKVNDPIELNADNVDAKLDEVWKKAKEDWDWGVDLQGAIHKAREIFNKEKEKNRVNASISSCSLKVSRLLVMTSTTKIKMILSRKTE